jgi:hypothetical protein
VILVCGVSSAAPARGQAVSGIYTRDHSRCYLLIVTLLAQLSLGGAKVLGSSLYITPYITPPSKARHHDMQGSPGGCQVHSSKGDLVEDSHVNMAHCAGVFAVELHYLRLCMYLYMHLPLIVTLVITLPLDQVLQVVVAHSAVQYSLDLVLFLTIDKSWG